MLRKERAALLAVATALSLLAGCGELTLREDLTSSSSPSASPSSSSSSSSTADHQDRRLRFPCNLTDSFNPFTCKTATNLHLAALLYQPLVQLSEAYQVENVLAADVRLDGLVCTVTVDTTAKFTNGETLTADDVAASCRAAMQSPHYAASLANIEEVSAEGETLRITLRETDAYFVNLLTFPIVQAGTQDDALPLGTGRYLLRGLESGEPILAANNLYYTDTQPAFRIIALVDNPDTREQAYDLRLGNLDLVAEDVTDKDVLNIGTAAYYDTNALVYLGFQCSSGVTRDVALRTALAGALDSASILSEAYSGSGTSARTLLNPNAFPDLTSSLPWGDSALLSEYLSTAGYTSDDAEGYRVNADGQRLTLELLVNSDNPARYAAAEQLAQQCKAFGVEVVLSAEPYDTYVAALQNGEFDLYLAEVRLPLNFDLTALLSPASGAVFGFSEDEELLYTHMLFHTGGATAQQLVDQFEARLPFLPLFYHASSVVYTRELLHVSPLQQDLFQNLEEWRFAEG